jgi:hypothetical protein
MQSALSWSIIANGLIWPQNDYSFNNACGPLSINYRRFCARQSFCANFNRARTPRLPR